MSKPRKAAKLAIQVAIGLLLLAWIFHSIFLYEAKVGWSDSQRSWDSLSRNEQWSYAWQYGPAQLWKTVRVIDGPALALSLVVMGSTIVLCVIRWRMILHAQHLDLSLARVTGISFIAHFFNSFFLGTAGGDLIKAYYVARETHHKKAEAVVTVFVDRLIGLWAMLLFGNIMVLWNWNFVASNGRFVTLAAIIFSMFCALTVLLFVALWGGVSKVAPRFKQALLRLPKGAALERSLVACRGFGRQPGLLVKTIAISCIVNFVSVLHVLVICRGLQVQVSMLDLLTIVPIISCFSALPITPSGLGIRENLFVFLLAAPSIAVPATAALSVSLLAYAGSLFWSAIGGVVYVTLKKREHLEEVVDADEDPA